MRHEPWKYSEVIAVGLGLAAVGVLLQVCTGGIDWDALSYPANAVLVVLLVVALLAMHAFRREVSVFEMLGSGRCAVVSICLVAAMTASMGLIRQAASYTEIPGALGRSGLRQMLSAWYFVLPYLWMTVSLGMAILRVLTSRHTARTIPFILNHLGLFLVLVCGAAGSADTRRLVMKAFEGKPEWCAFDKAKPYGEPVNLPFAVELNDFIMEEYPPVLMLMDNSSLRYMPENRHVSIVVGEDRTAEICGWTLSVTEFTDNAAMVSADSAGVRREGWVSCGSHLSPASELELGSKLSVVMPPRSPKRYASDVTIYVMDPEAGGRKLAGTIEVNHPLTVKGWKIYQLDYDKSMGNDSGYSIFELVKDPWLPAVYAGIIMMLAGAVTLFLTAPGRIRKEEEDA
ncbi:MAG: cytochrome c biogenesis protein ResB [Bacteroidales bacterium]|nr:cytochrome c biogenesis protein ResB [Bacteroidales bacterium]